jgi:5,10-methylenetetrahydromethanopterin reductase
MQLSLGVVSSNPIQSSIKYAQLAENKGFKRIWVGEDIRSREIFSYISIIALRTNFIGIASGITSPYVRRIAALASSVAAVQHLSHGRFTLGIGPGGRPEVKKMLGKDQENVIEVMKETTMLIRRILKGESISYKGVLACLSDYRLQHPDLGPVDIYFGVRGPKLLTLAGEIADGVIFSGPLSYMRNSIRIVEDSARKKGRELNKIVKVLWNAFLITHNKVELKSAKPIVATMIASMPQEIIESVGIDKETASKIQNFFEKSRYGDAYSLVGEDMIREFMIAGSKSEVEEQIEKLRQMGFEEIILGPPYGEEPLKIIEYLGDIFGEK